MLREVTYMLFIVKFFLSPHTVYIKSILNFILSLENDVMATSKLVFSLLIFILNC